jgi:hypothetical protein
MSTHSEALEDIKKAKDALDAAGKEDLTVTAPDPKLHRNISFVKSAVRILAGLAIAGGGWLEMNPYIQAGGLLIAFAEILGIAEELV